MSRSISNPNTMRIAMASGTEIYTLVGHPALTKIFMALQHELGPPALITCGRSKAATPADLVAADALDTLVIEGMRAEMLGWFPQGEISGVRRRQGIHVSAPHCPYLFHHANMITGRQVGLDAHLPFEEIIGRELGNEA